MTLKKWAALTCAMLMFAAAISGCGSGVSTKVETVTKSAHPVALTIDANITALHMTNVVPKLSGKLVSTPLVKGQDVKAGEVIVQVDSAPYQQSVQAAEAELIQATSAAVPQTYTAPAADTNSGTRQQLRVYEQQTEEGIFTRAELSTIRNRMQPPTQTYTSAPAVDSARIAQLQQAIQSARDMLGNAVIYSPMDGKVTAVSDNPSVAVAGNVLATIQQMSPLVATFAVPEMYIEALNAAKKAGTLRVSVMAPSGESQTGELTYLSNAKDPSTGSYMAKITFHNDKNLFVPGEFYHVRISTPQEVSQVTVPKTAVRTKDSGDFVYIVNSEGLADARSVLTGDEEDGRVVILEGLQEGDKVVVDPPDNLEIGMKVHS